MSPALPPTGPPSGQTWRFARQLPSRSINTNSLPWSLLTPKFLSKTKFRIQYWILLIHHNIKRIIGRKKHTITNINFHATTTEQHGVTEPLIEPKDRCSRSPRPSGVMDAAAPSAPSRGALVRRSKCSSGPWGFLFFISLSFCCQNALNLLHNAGLFDISAVYGAPPAMVGFCFRCLARSTTLR